MILKKILKIFQDVLESFIPRLNNGVVAISLISTEHRFNFQVQLISSDLQRRLVINMKEDHSVNKRRYVCSLF